MKVVTPAQMRQMDESAIQDFGIPGIVLMERAALGAVNFLEERFELFPGDRIALICGGGNNGGDGFAMARMLLERGYFPEVFILSPPSSYRGDALTNLESATELVPVHDLSSLSSAEVSTYLRHQDEFEIWCDAVFGTGLSRPVEGRHLAAIEFLKGCPVFAVDIPSGLNALTGEVLGACAPALATATFGAPKLGLCLPRGLEYCGITGVVDIGIPNLVAERIGWEAELLEQEFFRLPPRPIAFHKGNAGRLLLVGGQTGQLGSILMSTRGALYTGAGLLVVATVENQVSLVPLSIPEAMSLDMASVELEDRLDWCDIAAIGPGLGTNADALGIWAHVLQEVDACVIDADGLNLLASNPRELPERTILTPHPGEMARILGKPTAEIIADPLAAVREAADRYQAVVVLKGAATLIASPDGRLGISHEGNPGMATGGMGDALTGIAAALLHEFEDPFEAACCAVWAHGHAGDLASIDTGERGLTVSALLEQVPEVMRELES